MTVTLPVFIKGRIFRLSAERIYNSKTLERFKIFGNDRVVIVEGNIPELRTRKRKGERVTWKTVSGVVKNAEIYLKVLDALEMKSRSGAFDEFPSIDE
jgi:hypothetical protein